MGDIKGEMNMYADDISVSETEVKGKLKKIKNSEEYRKFEQNEQRQAEKNGTWMHLEIDSHSSNEEFARVTAAVFMSRMNPTMEELRHPIDVAHARIYSRVLEMCTPVQIAGNDRRQTIGSRKQNVVKEVLDL